MPGYQQNGRPIVVISQYGKPWIGSVFTLRTPDGTHKNLSPYDVVEKLVAYNVKPVLDCQNVCGKATVFFRSAISDMQLPNVFSESRPPLSP